MSLCRAGLDRMLLLGHLQIYVTGFPLKPTSQSVGLLCTVKGKLQMREFDRPSPAPVRFMLLDNRGFAALDSKPHGSFPKLGVPFWGP